MFNFVWHHALPVIIFACCYGRIFYVIRRQRKVLTAGQDTCSQDVPMTTVSPDPNAGQVQQQATGAAVGAKLSHTEMNVLKTMIAVIVAFVISWTPGAFVVLFMFLMVGLFSYTTTGIKLFHL